MQQLDKLAREEAFFPGPLPLLLTALQLDDLAILLGGSDRASSQVWKCFSYGHVVCDEASTAWGLLCLQHHFHGVLVATNDKDFFLECRWNLGHIRLSSPEIQAKGTTCLQRFNRAGLWS